MSPPRDDRTKPDTPVHVHTTADENADTIAAVRSETVHDALDSDVLAPSQRYATIAKLGAGGMGEVTLCKDAVIGREVAMKVARLGLGSSGGARTRFLREARVQGRLEHPAIVPVYDLGLSENGEIYFTMKRVRGRSLEEMIASGAGRSPVSLRRLLTAFQSVASPWSSRTRAASSIATSSRRTS